jgi:hypothetical protein
MTAVTQCDKCKKTSEDDIKWVEVRAEGDDLDFCPGCYKAFLEWLKQPAKKGKKP